jgi:hypothetical protein
MKTNEKEIQKIFEEAENQYEYLIPLYKLAFGDKWDKIEKITGFPRVGKKLSDLIWKLAINFDKKHHPNVIAGGLWMNNGFSEGDKDFEDWEIDISDVTIIWK